MSTENATKLVEIAHLLNTATGKILEQTLRELAPPPVSTAIATAAEFDAAYAAAAAGAVLELAPAFTYPSAFTVDKPVTIRSTTTTRGRVSRTEPLPTFLDGLTVTADAVTLEAIAVQTRNEGIVLTGRDALVSRVRILGDPAVGAKRGIRANGARMTIRECWIDEIWQSGIETQAICAWDMGGGGLVIEDCYLCAAGVSVLLGGADAASADRMPHDVTLTRSTLTKNPAWYGRGDLVIKNALEFKACAGATVTDCVFEYAGTAQGQGAYLVVCTVRNQDGGAPWSAIRDVSITGCTGGHASGVISILGSDDSHPSGLVERLTMADCSFEDIDPSSGTWGAGRLFYFDRAPHAVTLSGITVAGGHLAAAGYFCGQPPTAMILAKMAIPPTEYGWKIDGGGSGRAALQAYAPDAQLDETIV